jgi:PAS domain S-box-containing protein
MAPLTLGRVLVVDDEVQLMDALVEALITQGYTAIGFPTGEAALEALQTQEFDLLLTDLMMPGMDGIALLKAAEAIDQNLVGIIMTGQGTVPTAVEAMKTGAFDYVLKPFRLDVILPVLTRAMELRRLHLENIQLRETVAIYNLSQTIAFSLDSKLVLENTADTALQQTDADEVSIMLFRPDSQELYIVAVRGKGREHLLGQHRSLQDGIAGWVASHLEPLILNGEVSDPRFAPIQPRSDVSSAICMPMMTAGKLVGILNVNRLQARRPFTPGEVKALSILTSAAGAALETEALYSSLELREKRFRALIENSSDAVSLLNNEGRFIYNSTSVQRVLGYTPEELMGQSAFDLIYPDDQQAMLRGFIEAAQKPRQIQTTELRVRHKDGTWRWIEGTAQNLSNEPSVQAIVVNFRDITERKQAEEQIQRQLRHLNSLRIIDTAISSSFDLQVILEIVLHQVVSELNIDASALLLLDSRSQMIEYAASRGFHSDALHHTKLKLGDGYASRAVLERKTIHISALMETTGKLAKSLWSAKEHFVDYYGVPLITKGEVKGVLEIYHRTDLKEDAEWLEFLETLAGQAAIAIDNAQLFDDLQRSNLDLEVRVVERTAALQRTNAELEHANRIKEEFLANMSHELRTPLTSVLGLSESLLEQRRGSLNEHQQRSLEIIEASGQHLLQLINDILDLSKIEAGKFEYYPQPVSVDDTCRSSLSFIKAQAAKKSITVTYIPELSISKIFADPRRLKQILVNLLSNAVKFTHENGEVILHVTTDLEQDLIRFAVIDNGIGISQQDLQRLFQPFVQVDSGLNRQHEGTGLGLALVQKLTDLHGGSVEVESEVGDGSRFTINLPCLQEEVAKLEKFEAKRTPPIDEQAKNLEVSALQPKPLGVILVADDNMPSILTIGEYLESHGYEVIAAHDGLEAIEKAETIHPDIILMDIQMPLMNGLEAIARLRGNVRLADIPIIALTALAMPGDRERTLLAGANEYISKPVSLKALRAEIANLLKGPSGR